MKASVIIPNLNGAGWLRDSIESIWAQTEQEFELIVIDNGSTDESLAIARSYCGRDRYTLIENADNTGFSHAVNQGIAIAKGEYAVLFNNDAFAEPDWLAELIRTADADPKIFAVSSLMLRYYEPELADDAGDYVTIFTPDGQYVKEQTMKYFETHLPPALFVRIHRSCIVNTEQILRVELFGKENYQVRLKNGVCLRASNAGYKLLKERLSL